MIRSLAIVVPIYNEAEALPELLAALHEVRRSLPGIEVNVLFVDDHSDDGSTALIRKACAETEGSAFIRLSRRSGSHIAIVAGFAHCRADCAAFIAADLQDPPQLLGQMLEQCRQGHDVVWAARDNNDMQGALDAASSRLFHWAMQRLSGLAALPHQASFALLSRRAYRNLARDFEPRSSLLAEIPRLGYAVATVKFRRAPRRKGSSKWSFARKLVAFFDAIVASTYVPLRLMAYTGIAVSTFGFLYAIIIVSRWFGNADRPEGWTSLIVVVLVLGGLQMLMLGIVGEYLWRTRESARRGALYLVEDSAGTSSNESDTAR